LKIGDGTSYLIDLPFVNETSSNSNFEEILMNHINNNTVHISPEDRLFWNNKLNLFLSDENLIFNRN
jgi:hypothetical protein